MGENEVLKELHKIRGYQAKSCNYNFQVIFADGQKSTSG
jgi:hypothetical protein